MNTIAMPAARRRPRRAARDNPSAGAGHRNPPARVLFILDAPTGEAAGLFRLLAEALDLSRYRLDAVLVPPAGYDDRGLQALLAHRGVDVDPSLSVLSEQDAAYRLGARLPGYDIVVASATGPALELAFQGLAWQPALIDAGRLSGPDAPDAVQAWQAHFEAALAARRPAPPPTLFRSFMQGGFECSTHVLKHSGRRLDIIASSGHEAHAESDYRQLAGHGMRTVRDGLRWHRIDQGLDRYDWSSFLPMLRAAKRAGTQVIWDLFHYGAPDGVDFWKPHFVTRFARFAAATARLVREESDEVPFYCPVNEMSFHSWAGGDVAYMNPFATGRGFELKIQLARASVAAMEEILAVDPRARFVHCEPAINIVPDPHHPERRLDIAARHEAQFQAWDLIAGRLWPQVGGREALLDILGVNYYFNNQWVEGLPPIDVEHPRYKPFSAMLAEAFARYGRPLFVAETGTEGERRPAWLSLIAAEVASARAKGVPVEGICLYPIVDHLGWDDDRECPNGLFSLAVGPAGRKCYQPLSKVVAAITSKTFTGVEALLARA